MNMLPLIEGTRVLRGKCLAMICLAMIWLAAWCTGAAVTTCAAAERPNIVFILSDDLAQGDATVAERTAVGLAARWLTGVAKLHQD